VFKLPYYNGSKYNNRQDYNSNWYDGTQSHPPIVENEMSTGSVAVMTRVSITLW